MSSLPPSSGSAADAAAASPAAAAAGADSGAPHAVRRQLETNRFVNQQKRRAWEKAKEESIVACRDFIGDFVRCTNGRTFTTIWACRGQNAWMTKCLQTYMETSDAKVSYDAGLEIKAQYEK